MTHEYDLEALERLAGAIIRTAYEDYIQLRKRTEALSNPAASINATRMIERIIAEEITYQHKISITRAMKHLNLIDSDFLPYAKSKAASQAQMIIKWFFGPSFANLSHGMDPTFLIERAEQEVKAWAEGRKPKNIKKARKDVAV